MEGFLFEIRYFLRTLLALQLFHVSCKLVNNGKTKIACNNTMVFIRKLLGMF